jgi:hypothetical protein
VIIGFPKKEVRTRLDRSHDGQDHTILPYANSPATGFTGMCTWPAKC